MAGDPENLTAQWHEARAADLLRPGAMHRLPGRAEVEAAAVHAQLARSLRTGELAKAVLEGGRANANGLRRLAERVEGIRR